MKKYINTSNYYLSTTTSKIEANITNKENWHFDVSSVTVDGVTLPLKGYYWVDVDFGDASKREIFRIKERRGYTLYFDQRISPNGEWSHASGASVGLRDFSQLLNSLSTNTDNFGEIEQTGDLSILVRGGDIYTPSNMNAETGKIHLDDAEFDSTYITANSTLYVIIENDIIAHPDTQGYGFAIVTSELLEESGQYPIAKIITGNTMIDQDNGITDLRANIIGQGNMRSEVYDPDGKKLDVYNYENFYNVPVAEDWDISDISDRAGKRGYWDDKQQQLVSGVNLATVNGRNLLLGGNIPADMALTCGVYFKTIAASEEGVEEYTLQHTPMDTRSFMVFSDSGTLLVENKDYIYNDLTYTITFINEGTQEPEPLVNENAYIWILSKEGYEITIGDKSLYINNGPTRENTLGHFSANQSDDDVDIDISPAISSAIGNGKLKIIQGLDDAEIFEANQSGDKTIALRSNVLATQEEYNNMPESKETDGNWYVLYEPLEE